MLKLPLVIFVFLLGGNMPVKDCFPSEYNLIRLLLLQDLQDFIFNFKLILLILFIILDYIKKKKFKIHFK